MNPWEAPLLTILAASAALTGPAPIAASWDLTEGAHHRWVVHSELQMPFSVALTADRNRDVRARTVALRLVMDCVAEAPSARAGFLRCEVEDASVAGTAWTSDRGRLLPVLLEVDAKLTGAEIDLVLRPDGRLRTVRLTTTRLHQESNARIREMDEVLRALVLRSLAGFDLVIPADGFVPSGWPQFQAAVFGLPTLHGTFGAGELVHTAEPWDGGRVLVSSRGRAMLVDGGRLDNGPMYLDTRVTGHTVFDLDAGRIAESAWEIRGESTASSGPFMRTWMAQTTTRALGADEEVTLPPTEEWDPWLLGP